MTGHGTTLPRGPAGGTVERLAAVVLAGGSARRLDGADKAALVVDGDTLLDRALAATAAAEEVVVVGPAPSAPGTTDRAAVRWTREDPPGGGPAAGVLAGLEALRSPCTLVLVVAVDMPRVTARTVGRLLAALAPPVDGAVLVDGTVLVDGAVLVDETGRRQPLCGIYRRAGLAGLAPAGGSAYGLPMHRLLAGLRLVEVPAAGQEAHDVDTWDDLRALGG